LKALLVNGQDRRADLGRRIETAAARQAPPPAGGEIDEILALGRCSSEAEYLDRSLALLRTQHGVQADRVVLPAPGGPGGGLAGALRRLLWRLLRNPLDQLACQQNAINAAAAAGQEFLRDDYTRRIAELERRIQALEAARAEPAPRSPPS
jgi:hypothetical protein